MLIKLDDAERVVHAAIINLCLKDKDTCAGDYSAYALQALRALPVSDGWEDIATAPRDGTDILVYCGPAFDPMWAVACWTDDQWDVWYAQGDGPQCWEYWKPLGPLPAPPSE